jgi:glycosyltransferase involved in cell wall biosynthesis
MKPSILFFVPEHYDNLVTKGVEKMIFERDENDFFQKVIIVHPLCYKTRSLKLSESFDLFEIGFDLIPNEKRSRLLIYLQLPVHFIRVIWGAVRLAKKFKIDLIRANDPYWMGLFAYIVSKICNIPFCVSIHADYEKRMELDKNLTMCSVFGSYKLAIYLERFILSKSPMVMPIRETLGVKAVANCAPPESIRVIPHGIDLSPFVVPPKHDIHSLFGLNPNSKIISFVGRFSKENYIDDIIEIALKLGQQRDDFVFVMAGGGKEELRIKAKVEEDPFLNKHVVLTGFQQRYVCFDIRRASYISLCLMSGFSLIEACAAAHPVVAYDVEWHFELVKNNETGFLVKENDVDGIVKALDWLLDHPEESEKMGQNAKALAFELHDLKKTTIIQMQWYSELLNKGKNC